jgi:hypothetical protein
MGKVRGWGFDAVIGVGGIRPDPGHERIARKITWVGTGTLKICDDPVRAFVTPDCPLVTFEHFLYYGEEGPLLTEKAPNLARRMYGKNVRVLMNSLSPKERREVEGILELARNAPPSSYSAEPNVRDASDTCPPKSRDVRTTNDCQLSKRRKHRGEVICKPE